MTKSLLGDLAALTLSDKKQWVDCFDSFQDHNDGLFYDPSVHNDIFADGDWWGARHLALHMISAYTDLRVAAKISLQSLGDLLRRRRNQVLA